MTIVITLPHFFDGEVQHIIRLLDRGDIDLLHIRKPQATCHEVEALISQLPETLRHRMVLHDHHTLAMQYGLHGIHLNSRNPEAPEGWHGSLSISCHSISELEEQKKKPFNYLSLSPIFDSISKQGYLSAFSQEEIQAAHRQGIIDHRVMALGGVTFDKIPIIQEMGFGGAMILGDAWR